MSTTVPMQTTPISESAAVLLLQRLLPEFVPVGLSREIAMTILAHLWVENAHGGSVQNHNFGNISADPNTWPGSVWRPTWFTVTDYSSERDKYLHGLMLQGKAPKAFRAYDTFEEGLRAYLKLVQGNGMLAVAGNVFDYASRVYASGYCRDDACRPEKLGPTLKSLVAGFEVKGLFSNLPKALSEPEPGSGSSPLPDSSSGVPSRYTPAGELPKLERGFSGPAVFVWQRIVCVYLHGKVDGMFGLDTEQATKSWQIAHGVAATGKVTALEWSHVE